MWKLALSNMLLNASDWLFKISSTYSGWMGTVFSTRWMIWQAFMAINAQVLVKSFHAIMRAAVLILGGYCFRGLQPTLFPQVAAAGGQTHLAL